MIIRYKFIRYKRTYLTLYICEKNGDQFTYPLQMIIRYKQIRYSRG
jgi:hypothetical protein